MMKILLSAYACEPNRGSEPGFGWNWAWEYAKNGHDVWVLTRPTGKSAIQQILRQQPQKNLHWVFLPPPQTASRIFGGELGVYARYIAWQYRVLRVARKLNDKQQFDIIHHVTWGSLWWGSPLWRIGKPFVFGPIGGGQVTPKAFRNHYQHMGRLSLFRDWAMDRLLRWNYLARSTVRHAALVLATNRETKDKARSLGARSVKLFLDTSLPKESISSCPPSRSPSSPTRFLWVGRILPRKGLKLCLEALADISSQLDVSLTILGDGPLGPQVPNWIAELKLEHRCTWRGHVSWNEVRKAYREHDVFVFSSLRDSFGSQLLEAAAWGLPIICLDHQGARDFLPSGATIKVPVTTPKKTEKEFAAAMETLAREPQQRQRMGEIAWGWAKNKTWDKSVVKALKWYEELINKSPRNTLRRKSKSREKTPCVNCGQG